MSGHGGWGQLVRSVRPDPDGTRPQRGAIEERYAWHLRLVIRMATHLGRSVLNIEDALEKDVPAYVADVAKVRAACLSAVQSRSMEIGDFSAEMFCDLVVAELFGLGPLERFIQQDDLSEVMVNGPFIIFIEREGKLIETGHRFLDDAHVHRVIQRIVRPLGRDVNAQSPLVDARLPDGSRVNAAIGPCTLDGPSVTIRKFGRIKLKLSDLIETGSVSRQMADFLSAIVRARQNIVISGGTGSGKTTLINALSEAIPDQERVVTIEDAAELRLHQRHVVRLEAKKPSLVDPSEVTIRDCLVNALRMRPDRILIGECRNAEALDMLQAMNTGHDGSMTTVHANNPRESISRLETLALMSGLDLPLRVIRRQIATAVNFIVQASRLRDGSRKVVNVSEVQGMEGDTVLLSEIFVYRQTGVANGWIQGKHVTTGNRPHCYEQLSDAGIRIPPDFFMPADWVDS